MDNVTQRKRRKQIKTEAKRMGKWDRCMFKVVRKDRYCNIARLSGSLFCGNHLPVAFSKKSLKFKDAMRRWVPCPINSSHTVYEYDLTKHLLVCNSVKDAETMKSLPYYCYNVNSGVLASNYGLSMI